MELNVKQKSVVDILYKTYKSDTVYLCSRPTCEEPRGLPGFRTHTYWKCFKNRKSMQSNPLEPMENWQQAFPRP